MRNVVEHITWTKQRAIETLELTNDPVVALASLQSDLLAHRDTERHDAIILGQMLAMAGRLQTVAEAREFIDGIR